MVGHEYVGGARIETVQADHLRTHAGQAHTGDRDPSADRVQEFDLPGDEGPGKRNEGADGREQRPEGEHQQSAECGEHGSLQKKTIRKALPVLKLVSNSVLSTDCGNLSG